MNQIAKYRFALYFTLSVLLLIGFAYKCEREHVARLVKWGNEDAEIILNQELKIEALQEQLDAEKKARQDKVQRLSSGGDPFADQYMRDLESRLRAYEVTYPDPGSIHAVRRGLLIPNRSPHSPLAIDRMTGNETETLPGND
jgi:hypothetical protein